MFENLSDHEKSGFLKYLKADKTNQKIKSSDNLNEIVDFKSEQKPDINSANERLEHYRRQLNIYAYLVEQGTRFQRCICTIQAKKTQTRE